METSMRSPVVEAYAPPRVPYFVVVVCAALLATLLLLATPAAARAQAEWNIGPFLDYSTIHGGHPANAGLQTSVLVGPVGLRVSGFHHTRPAVRDNRAERSCPLGWRRGSDADLRFRVPRQQRHWPRAVRLRRRGAGR